VGRLVQVSPAFAWLSFAIGTLLVIGALVLLIGNVAASDLVSGLAAGIGVPIWAYMIARATPHLSPRTAGS